MSATRLILCRHGEPDESARGRFCGAIDVGLSPRGELEADALGAGFVAASPAAVYTSPMRRSRETAVRIGSALGLDPIADERLREIDFGEVDGLTFAEVEVARPDLYADWLRTPTLVRFPGGECFADLQGRAVEAATELTARHVDRTVVVATHAGVIRSLLAAWLSLPDEALFRIDQRYGSVNVVDWLDGTPVLRLINGLPGSAAQA